MTVSSRDLPNPLLQNFAIYKPFHVFFKRGGRDPINNGSRPPGGANS